MSKKEMNTSGKLFVFMIGFFGILLIGMAICYFTVGIKTADSKLGWFSDAVEQAISGMNFLAPAMFVVAIVAGVLGFLCSVHTLGEALGIIIVGVFFFVFHCFGAIETGGFIAIIMSLPHGAGGVMYIVRAYKLNKEFEK